MPVFVTHADTAVGVAVVRALGAEGADVRAFASGDGDVGAVRDAGAIVAVGDHDDEGHLEAAMTHAHTVILPSLGWLTPVGEVERGWPTIVGAATQAAVSRIVMVSLVGADVGADVPLLASLGAVEDSLVDSAPQTLVVRTDGVVEGGHEDVAAVLATVPACRDAVMAPVARVDLVAGLVALDAARSGRPGGHALFTALGPAQSTVPSDDGAGTESPLVGRRWLPPDRRADLVRAVCGRRQPGLAGADLWDLVR